MDAIKFIGREAELQALQDLYKKRTASLVVIKGRRRIGKTRLIEEFAKDKPFLRFVGLAPAKGVTAQSERDEFARLLSQQTGLPEVTSNDWAKLFALLAEKVKQGRHVILFDEITWMATGDPTFLSKLKNIWELSLQQNPQLILVLCGSISTWIEENILSSTGYFGRISQQITLHELTLSQSNKLLQALGFGRSAYEKFLYLSLSGGVPWYIELVNPAYSAAENIKKLCFEPDGILVNEHQYIFHDLFGKRSEIYGKITRFLATHTAEYHDIVKGVQYTSSGLFSTYLEALITSGYVSRSYAWDIKTGNTKNISLYRLSDHYLRFYYKYIQPKLRLVQQGQYRDISISALPGWN
ncbi:MAG: ATPase family protein, partial [uncultured bacterium]